MGIGGFCFCWLRGLVSQSSTALTAILIGMVAFLPGVWKGKTDITLFFLLSFYLTHYLFFQREWGFNQPSDWALFAFQGVAVNCGVVFVRTLLTYARPQANLMPFRLAAFFYAVIGMGLALQDLGIAWQVYGAYGVLALSVSCLHYHRRYWGVGVFLLFVSAEIFFFHHGYRYIETFVWPIGFLFIIAAWATRDKKNDRDFLLGLSQVVMYAPSSVLALKEHWGPHGLMLGAASLTGLLAGISLRNKCLTVGSVLVFLGNAVYQSRDLIWNLPGWAFMGLGYVLLIALAAAFEFQKETISGIKDSLAAAWDRWD